MATPKREADRRPVEPDWDSFKGYPRPGWTMIPHEILDYHLAFLTGNEVKALLYLARKTFGWQGKEQGDRVSLNQMLYGVKRRDGSYADFGVGMSRSGLVAALANLEKRQLIHRERQLTTSRGHEPTVYRLHVAPDPDPSTLSELGVEQATDPSTPSGQGVVRSADKASSPSGLQQKKTRQEKTEPKKEPPTTPPEGAVEPLLEVLEDSGPSPEDRVWQAYREALAEFGKNPNEYRFTEPLRALVRSRLAEYPIEDLMDAAKGWLRDPFYRVSHDRGKPYYGLAMLLAIDRRRNNVEKLRDLERDFRAGRIKPAAVTRGGPAQPSIKRDPSEYAGWDQHGLHITENQA